MITKKPHADKELVAEKFTHFDNESQPGKMKSDTQQLIYVVHLLGKLLELNLKIRFLITAEIKRLKMLSEKQNKLCEKRYKI